MGGCFGCNSGPLSNICLALFFGLLIRVSVAYDIVTSPAFISIASIVVIVNLVLALFNLVPIPPLDGSKILFSFLPFHWSAIKNSLEQYGIFLLLIFIFFLWQYLLPLISIAFTLITGLQI